MFAIYTKFRAGIIIISFQWWIQGGVQRTPLLEIEYEFTVALEVTSGSGLVLPLLANV